MTLYLTHILLSCNMQVETQRVQFKRLTRTLDPLTGMEMGVQPNNRLTAERLQKLDAIGFAWSAKHVRKNTTISATGNLSNNNAALIDGPRYNISTSQAFSKTAVEGDMGISAIDSAMRTTLLPNAQELQPQQRRQRLNDAQWEGEIVKQTHYLIPFQLFLIDICYLPAFRHVSAPRSIQDGTWPLFGPSEV
jgi:hypothetical protein